MQKMKKYLSRFLSLALLLCFAVEANSQCTTPVTPSNIVVTETGVGQVSLSWDMGCAGRTECGAGESLFWYVGFYGQNSPSQNGINAEYASGAAITCDDPAGDVVGSVISRGGDIFGDGSVCLDNKASTCVSSELGQAIAGACAAPHTWDVGGMCGIEGAQNFIFDLCPGQCYNVFMWELVAGVPSGYGGNNGGTNCGIDAGISCGEIPFIAESPVSDVVRICLTGANDPIEVPVVSIVSATTSNGDPAVCATAGATFTGDWQAQPEDEGDPTASCVTQDIDIETGFDAATCNVTDSGSGTQVAGGNGGDVSVSFVGGGGNSANGLLQLGTNVQEVNCRDLLEVGFSTPTGCNGVNDLTVFGLPICPGYDATYTDAIIYISNNGVPINPNTVNDAYPACVAAGAANAGDPGESGTIQCQNGSNTNGVAYPANWSAQFGAFLNSTDNCVFPIAGNPFEGGGSPFDFDGVTTQDFGDGVLRQVSTICVRYEDPCDGSKSATCVKFISDASPISAAAVACDETCPGSADGAIRVYDILGGSADPNGDADYADGNGAGYILDVISGPATGQIFSYVSGATWEATGLAPGLYTIEVRDNLAPTDTAASDADDTTAACGAACPVTVIAEVLPGPILNAAAENIVAVSCDGPGTASIAVDKISTQGNGPVTFAGGPDVPASGPVFGEDASVLTTSGLNAGCPSASVTGASIAQVCVYGMNTSSGGDLGAVDLYLIGPLGSISNFDFGTAFSGNISGTGPLDICFTADFSGNPGDDLNGDWTFEGYDGFGGTFDIAGWDITFNDLVCTTEEDIMTFCGAAGPDEGDGAGGISSVDQTLTWTTDGANDAAAEPFNFLTFPGGAADGETTVEFDNDAALAGGVAAGTQICYDASGFVPGNNFAAAVTTDVTGYASDCYVGACCEVTSQVCFTVVDCRTCPTAGEVLASPSPICDGSSFDLTMVVAADENEDGIADVDAAGAVIPVDPASYTEGVDYYITWDVSADGGVTWANVFNGDPYGPAMTGGAATTYTPPAPASGCTPDVYQFRAAVACLLPGEPFTPSGLPITYNGSFAFADACSAIAGADPSVVCATYDLSSLPPCAEITTYSITGAGDTGAYSPSWPSEMNIAIVDPTGTCTNVFNGAAAGLPNTPGPFAFSDILNTSLQGAPASGTLQVCFFDDFADIPDGDITDLSITVDYVYPPGCESATYASAEDPASPGTILSGEVCTAPILGVDYALPAPGCDPNIVPLCATGLTIMYSADGGATYASADPYDSVSITAADDTDRSDLTVEYQIMNPACPAACNAVTGTFDLEYPDPPVTSNAVVCEDGAAMNPATGLNAACGNCADLPAPTCTEGGDLAFVGPADDGFGGTQNAQLFDYTSTCNDATITTPATASTLTVSVTNYSAFGLDPVCTSDAFWVTIYVGGVTVYDVQYDNTGASTGNAFAGTIDPSAAAISLDVASGDYNVNQGDLVEVFVYPTCQGNATTGVNTTYPTDWSADISSSFSATFTGTSTPGAIADVSWWDAAIGGTQLATTADFMPSPLPTAPGEYTYYAQCECAGCASLREPATLDVYALPVITLVETICLPGGGGNYDAVIDVDLGAWNSILDGVDASYTITSTVGTPPGPISASGQYTISNITNMTNTIVGVVTGAENNGCAATFEVEAPVCCPMSVEILFRNETLCTEVGATPIPDADILAGVDIPLFAYVEWLDASGAVVDPAAWSIVNNGCSPITETYIAHVRCTLDPAVDLIAAYHNLTAYPAPRPVPTTENCIAVATPSCPNAAVVYDNDGDGIYSDLAPPPVIPDGDITVNAASYIPGAPPGCFGTETYTAGCVCDLVEAVVSPVQGIDGVISPFWYNAVTIDVIGGIGPYSWDWDRSGYVRWDIQDEFNDDATGGAVPECLVHWSDGADWVATITDAVGCQVIVSDNSFTSANGEQQVESGANTLIDIYDFTLQGETNDDENGSIEVCLEGGVPPYSLTLYESGWTNQDPIATASIASAGACHTFSGLEHSHYIVEVTSADNQITEGWYWVPLDRKSGRLKTGEASFVAAYPNPFAEMTNIEFSLTMTSEVSMEIIDVTGKLIAVPFKGTVEEGQVYQIPFDGSKLASGIYICRLTGQDGVIETTKLVLTKQVLDFTS